MSASRGILRAGPAPQVAAAARRRSQAGLRRAAAAAGQPPYRPTEGLESLDATEGLESLDASNTLISSLSALRGGEAGPTRLVLADVEGGWEELDAKVNTYPSVREFKIVGVAGSQGGSEDFGEELRRAEVVVVGSRTGKYVSVRCAVEVTSGRQVQAIYAAVRADPRMKFFL